LEATIKESKLKFEILSTQLQRNCDELLDEFKRSCTLEKEPVVANVADAIKAQTEQRLKALKDHGIEETRLTIILSFVCVSIFTIPSFFSVCLFTIISHDRIILSLLPSFIPLAQSKFSLSFSIFVSYCLPYAWKALLGQYRSLVGSWWTVWCFKCD
jgi:hypothetical protein